jgi:hypothetical protein
MKRPSLSLFTLSALFALPIGADAQMSPPVPPAAPAGAMPAAAPTATPIGNPNAPNGHPYDPCAMVSQTSVAAAAGVATNQVFTPARPTENECVWAVANKSGTGAQQIALTVQTVNQVNQAHGIAKFGAILTAASQIPGVPMPTNPAVTRAFSDAQVVVGLGDKAGWKNGTLSVLKNEALVQVTATGQGSDSESLAVSKSIATSALTNLNTTK